MDNINQLAAAIHRNLLSFVSMRLRDLPIQCGQHIFLYVILCNEGISQQEMSETLFIGKSTTAKAVKHLISLGYIHKERDKTDRRRERLYVTDKGKALASRIRETYEETVRITKRDLTPEENEKAIELLNRILGSVLEAKEQMSDNS